MYKFFTTLTLSWIFATICPRNVYGRDGGNQFRLVPLSSSVNDFKGNFVAKQLAANGFTDTLPPYKGARSTNGRVLIQLLAKFLKLKEDIHAEALGDYAHSSALASSSQELFCNLPAQQTVEAAKPICTPNVPGLLDQAGAYLKDVGGTVPSKDIVYMQISDNDIINAATTAAAGGDPTETLAAAVKAHVDATLMLVEAGAKLIIIVDGGAVPFLPFFSANKEAITSIVAGYNSELRDALGTLQQQIKARGSAAMVHVFDAIAAAQGSLARATRRGITTDAGCFNLLAYYRLYYSPKGGLIDPLPSDNSLGCDDPNSFFFMDGIHPTTIGYKLTARELLPKFAEAIREVYKV